MPLAPSSFPCRGLRWRPTCTSKLSFPQFPLVLGLLVLPHSNDKLRKGWFIVLKRFAQGQVMPFLLGASFSSPAVFRRVCGAVCMGCHSRYHCWAGKVAGSGADFHSYSMEKKIILLFLETQSFPNNRYFLQLQILPVERPPLTASALAPDSALADPTPKRRLLLSCPHVPSKQPCPHLPPLTHGPAAPSSPAPLNILFTCPAQGALLINTPN